jgi:hypothetical protein
MFFAEPSSSVYTHQYIYTVAGTCIISYNPMSFIGTFPDSINPHHFYLFLYIIYPTFSS